MPCPTADIGCALVKISASGPIPTSRYCDHMPFSTSSFLSAIAFGEPGFSACRSVPIVASISARIAVARSGWPRACSSIRRSSSDTTNVTPAALIACRSIGASSHGLRESRVSGGVLARISSRLPIRSPAAARRVAAGFSASQRSRIVGAAGVTSYTPSGRTATTAGPPTSGRQTRPARVARAASAGRVASFRICTVPPRSDGARAY